jgi:hypothetical protein
MVQASRQTDGHAAFINTLKGFVCQFFCRFFTPAESPYPGGAERAIETGHQNGKQRY